MEQSMHKEVAYAQHLTSVMNRTSFGCHKLIKHSQKVSNSYFWDTLLYLSTERKPTLETLVLANYNPVSNFPQIKSTEKLIKGQRHSPIIEINL